jgi:hypothetical protein
MEEMAMKLILSGVNSVMVCLYVMTTEPRRGRGKIRWRIIT